MRMMIGLGAASLTTKDVPLLRETDRVLSLWPVVVILQVLYQKEAKILSLCLFLMQHDVVFSSSFYRLLLLIHSLQTEG